jgi:hypothetical protein
MRKLATWLWLKTFTSGLGDIPNFMRINELPQTAPNNTNNKVPVTFFDMLKGSVKKFTTFYHFYKTSCIY